MNQPFVLTETDSVLCSKQIREHHLLEGAFDGRGCDFKVLVSPSVHPLVGGDSQSRNLREGKIGQPTFHRNLRVAQMEISTAIQESMPYLKVVCQM